MEDRKQKSISQPKKYFVHESAFVDSPCSIGEGTSIWNFTHIQKNANIGNHCNLGQNVYIGPGVRIGHRCKIQNNVSIYPSVTLEDGVFCGPSCVFTNVNNPRAFIERKHEFKKTLVQRGATIGANATIVCGVTIGEFAFVGAGALVKKDVPSHAIVVGVPSKRVAWACYCGVKLRQEGSEYKCDECNNVFYERSEGLHPKQVQVPEF